MDSMSHILHQTLRTQGFGSTVRKVRAIDHYTGRWMHAHVKEILSASSAKLLWETVAFPETTLTMTMTMMRQDPADWPIQPAAIPEKDRPAPLGRGVKRKQQQDYIRRPASGTRYPVEQSTTR